MCSLPYSNRGRPDLSASLTLPVVTFLAATWHVLPDAAPSTTSAAWDEPSPPVVHTDPDDYLLSASATSSTSLSRPAHSRPLATSSLVANHPGSLASSP